MPRKRAVPEPWASAMAAVGLTSRNELAEAAGIHPTTVARLIDDPDHQSSLEIIRAVAEALQLDVRDVAHWAGLYLEMVEPFIPAPESAILGREQRRLVNELIRALASTNRHPRPPLRIQTTGIMVVSDTPDKK
ncbi:helix-turn-helix domain-containing protein [Nocardia arizonensis]|uniref:helix-turn-helix domain-containing protein n=1 Tax=Nocardia arizonensis TaxID=1141647 RepID=UPI00138F5FE4|nr:helix-turn-helix transcriptional regulator [Nocardia arizonensis]